MTVWELPDPNEYGFDQVNVEPLGNISIVRCIRRSDGSRGEVFRYIVPYPYALLEVPMKELLGQFGEVTPFDRERVVAWGLRLFVDNGRRLKLREQRPKDPRPGLDVGNLLPANSWPQGPKGSIRPRKRG